MGDEKLTSLTCILLMPTTEKCDIGQNCAWERVKEFAAYSGLDLRLTIVGMNFILLEPLV